MKYKQVHLVINQMKKSLLNAGYRAFADIRTLRSIRHFGLEPEVRRARPDGGLADLAVVKIDGQHRLCCAMADVDHRQSPFGGTRRRARQSGLARQH
jgi:hypothetical protein